MVLCASLWGRLFPGLSHQGLLVPNPTLVIGGKGGVGDAQNRQRRLPSQVAAKRRTFLSTMGNASSFPVKHLVPSDCLPDPFHWTS